MKPMKKELISNLIKDGWKRKRSILIPKLTGYNT